MKTTFKLFVVLALVATFSSCKKNSSPDAKADFKMQEKSTANRNALARSIGSFTFTKALVGVKKVKFEMEHGDNDQEYKYKGAYTFDVLTGTSTPSIQAVDMQPGTYKKIKVKIDKVMSSGNSIEIAGTYAVGGLSYQFEFTSTSDQEYEVENPNGISVQQGHTVTFVLELDLQSLFSGVDFATATVDADGIIRINNSSNPVLQDIIEDNFDDIMDCEGHDHDD